VLLLLLPRRRGSCRSSTAGKIHQAVDVALCTAVVDDKDDDGEEDHAVQGPRRGWSGCKGLTTVPPGAGWPGTVASRRVKDLVGGVDGPDTPQDGRFGGTHVADIKQGSLV
jgi:hypothetical protein